MSLEALASMGASAFSGLKEDSAATRSLTYVRSSGFLITDEASKDRLKDPKVSADSSVNASSF